MAKEKNKGGRPPTYDRQVATLAKDVSAINKKLDAGLNKIADEYEDIVTTAIDLGLGRGKDQVALASGAIVEVDRKPNVQMLKHLLDVGIAMVDKTGGGPDSPSARIIESMRQRMGVTNNTQVNIDHITIPSVDGVARLVEGDVG